MNFLYKVQKITQYLNLIIHHHFIYGRFSALNHNIEPPRQSVQSVLLQNIEDVLNNLFFLIHQRKKFQPINNPQTTEKNTPLR